MGGIFVLAPLGLIHLNRWAGLPRWQTPIGAAAGGLLMFLGIGLAAYCSRLFARVGGGTPVPIEPPRWLVACGLYRFSRNPIYVADVLILFGLFLHRGEVALLFYAIAFAIALHLWIVRVEEPGLRRRFGDDFERFARNVPRWI